LLTLFDTMILTSKQIWILLTSKGDKSDYYVMARLALDEKPQELVYKQVYFKHLI